VGATGAQGPQGPIGPQGLQGPAGPTEGWVNRNAAAVAVGTTRVVVATLTLPAGDYLLYAKGTVVRTGGNGTSECTLMEAATTLDTTANQSTTTGELAAAHGFVSLPATATVTFGCRMTSGTANVSNRTLSAVRFTTLTVQ
jgi:hypothetical protein